MSPSETGTRRLINQQIASPRFKKPAEVVAALGAMQAQDYGGALWSIGLRLPDATEAEVIQAVADRTIVRTWPMRGTLHFVAAADVRWMLELLTPRIVAGAVRRRQQLELDDAVFTRCRKVFVRALQGDKQLTRDALLQVLERAGIPIDPHRGYHILWRLAQEGLICFAARSGKQPTFALLDEWVPAAKRLDRDAALAELARRYFIGHGPATLADFVWWSGLKVSDAKAGLEHVNGELSAEVIEGKTYWLDRKRAAPIEAARAAFLLPGFDEYLLGYKDRSGVLPPQHAEKICPGGNGVFRPTMVIDGRVVGTWKRVRRKKHMAIEPAPFLRLKQAQQIAFAHATERYGRFVGQPAIVANP